MSHVVAPTGPPSAAPPSQKRDRTHYLYVTVILAMIAGIVVGLLWPAVGVSLRPLGTGFVNLIRMLISPVLFCTIVLGVGSVRHAGKMGKVGVVALGYFLVLSTIALVIGLVVGNLLEPGSGLNLTEKAREAGHAAVPTEAKSTTDFILGIIPTTLVSSLTSGEALQTLFVSLLVGFALQMLGHTGEAVLRGVKHMERLVFRIMSMIMWLAPIGAFGAMAAIVGATGWKALSALAQIMAGFYIACIAFIVVILGPLLLVTIRMNIFTLLRYFGREFLLILATSSSESALPRFVAKLEHLGISRSAVGLTVPLGYSFNLDGGAIYLTMASLFIAEALGKPMSLGEQISLLVFMLIASKGIAGVTGSGLAVLASGLQSHRPDLVDGIGLIVGIDRFMSEARALTSFAGNAVAIPIIAQWTGELDRDQAKRVLKGEDPFDETTMLDNVEPPAPPDPVAAQAGLTATSSVPDRHEAVPPPDPLAKAEARTGVGDSTASARNIR
jgi:aerobic C4-dicarboxylate transport protein